VCFWLVGAFYLDDYSFIKKYAFGENFISCLKYFRQVVVKCLTEVVACVREDGDSASACSPYHDKVPKLLASA
jgi:hypothetical protein